MDQSENIKGTKLRLINNKPQLGRKKLAVAKANLYESLEEGFQIVRNGVEITGLEREFIVSELPHLGFSQLGNVIIKVGVKGGGVSSQRLASLKAIAKLLIERLPLIKPTVKHSKHAYSDWRRAERKHPGNLKARKQPAGNRR